MREVARAKSRSSAIVEPLIPPAQHGLRERSVNVREVLNGIFNVHGLDAGRRQLLKGLPLRTILSDDIELWNWDRTLDCNHHALYTAVREQVRR